MYTQTSLVSRTVSSSRLSTASVSMATWGRNRLVVWERNTVVVLTTGYMLSGLCLQRLWGWVRDDRVTVIHVERLRWVNHYRFCLGSQKTRQDGERATERKCCERVTFMKADATRIVGHVRYTWKKDREKYISRGTREIRVAEILSQRKRESHKQTEQQFVMLSVRRQSRLQTGIVPDLPPAVCHSEGDGHGRPFAPIGRRLLAVPENDDLEQRGEGILHKTKTDGLIRLIKNSRCHRLCLHYILFYHHLPKFVLFTCEQYFDLETTWSSFMIGWDWETNGETAWMTAVNSWPGLTPEHRHEKK